mgnify:FL=1|tara:strand:- start:252 stop:443 length:192 start_codon:yes stop_codon:yes gene_type:complete
MKTLKSGQLRKGDKIQFSFDAQSSIFTGEVVEATSSGVKVDSWSFDEYLKFENGDRFHVLSII